MSIELVGFENLPNAFIKNIEINSSNQKNILVKTEISVHDLQDGSLWSDTSEDIAKLMRVGVVFSSDIDQIQSLSNGTISPMSLNYESRAMNSANIIDSNLVYTFSFSKTLPSNIDNLVVFAFCFIDKEAMTSLYGFEIDADYYGPIKSEKIFENSEIVTTSYAFRNGNQYWSGPVHVQNGVYMAGSYHTPRPHQVLTRIQVANTKIKDLREKIETKTSRKISTTNYISNLIVSYNSETDVNCLFMINIINILNKKTKYGNFLSRASQQVLTEIMNRFRIKLLTIQRQRVKKTLFSGRLRTKKSMVQSVFSKKNIIKSHDNPQGIIVKNTRLERNGSYDVVEESFEGKITDYKKIATISEIFLDYGFGIRTFQLNDYELTEDTPGIYKYNLSFQFVDPVEKFLQSTMKLMKTDISNLSVYSNYFAKKQNPTFNIQDMVESYSKYYSYIYNTNSSQIEQMNVQNLNLMNLQTATLSSIKKFEKKYKTLYSEYLTFLGYDDVKRKNTSISISSKNSTTGRVVVEHLFDEDIEPTKNKVSLSYMEKENQNKIKIFSKSEYIEQTQKQVAQHYTGNPSIETKQAPKVVSRKLNDITKNSPVFFSPILMKTKKTKIRLDNSFSVKHDIINLSLSKVSPPSISIKKVPEVLQETEQERFLETQKVLGSGHEFVTYSESDNEYNKIDPKIKSMKKIDDYFSGFKSKRSFVKTLETVRDLSEKEAEELPNQIKAVIAGESEQTRDNFVVNNNDLLAHPTTKNYYELRNFSVQMIKYIDRFEKDKDGNILLNKPVYKKMLADDLNKLNKPVVCMMENYTNNKFKITDENKVAVLDSSFILSDRDISVPNPSQNLASTSSYNIVDIEYHFMSSNLVTQTNQAMKQPTEATSAANIISPELIQASIGTLFGSY